MSLGDAWSDEPDFVNRDPEGISEGLQVSFEDVLGEPEHTHSSECAWKCAYRCFRVWKMLCYSIFTTCCGWACGMGWGCHFAGVAIWYIWCLNPYTRSLTICLDAIRRINTAQYEACLGPYCAAIGHIFDAFRRGDDDTKKF